ncbi:MAG: hypothetical protein HYZ58_09965 [Acidobacteria bacterium]|nr:hypothetical protein [Acidobacteriota bacterium]
MPKTRPNATVCPVCARLARAWAGIPQFERPQCLRCYRSERGRPLLVPPARPLVELLQPPALSAPFTLREGDERRVEGRILRAGYSLTSRQVDHRYRMLDHLRRQAQIAARRVLEAAG